MTRKRWIISLCLTLLAAGLFIFIPNKQYQINKGYIFGTYYNIQYEASKNMQQQILNQLNQLDASLSMFNSQSTLAHINNNETSETDALFNRMYTTALEVNELSHGAFDITCQPLVNLWGFGTDSICYHPTQRQIDSILSFVGMSHLYVDTVQCLLVKYDSRTRLDASAIAKGLACDIVAQFLKEQGCKNYLVDIGGEVVAKGNNSNGEGWHVGITKPIDDPTGEIQEMEEVIVTHDLCIASSGNYRRFYYDGNQRRSHTIDPRTGYTVQHHLLSASVVASSCMQADALATACMVLGEEEAMVLIESVPDAACMLITTDSVITSNNWPQ